MLNIIPEARPFDNTFFRCSILQVRSAGHNTILIDIIDNLFMILYRKNLIEREMLNYEKNQEKYKV